MSAKSRSIQDIFIGECEDCIADLHRSTGAMLDIENWRQALDQAFRAAHTIKGGAAMLGNGKIQAVAHKLEDELDEMRRASGPPAKSVVNDLHFKIDALQDAILSSSDPTGDKLRALGRASGGGPSAMDLELDCALAAGSTDGLLDRLRAVTALGKVEFDLDPQSVPELTQLDPRSLGLRWHLRLESTLPRESVVSLLGPILRLSEGQEDKENRFVATQVVSAPIRSVRIDSGKIDSLVNLIGEIVIAQSSVQAVAEKLVRQESASRLFESIAILRRHTRDLQEGVMALRAIPVQFVFDRATRAVRDLEMRTGKTVRLRFEGGDLEVEKAVIDRITDPVIHIIRNAIDHGIEQAGERIPAGKPAEGSISVVASQKVGRFFLKICDDGKGLDRAAIRAKAEKLGLLQPGSAVDQGLENLIFEPGFSTAAKISDISGRGVGLDIVARNIAALGGQVSVSSVEGEGTQFLISLPLSLSILDAVIATVGSNSIVIPIGSVLETLVWRESDANALEKGLGLYRHRGALLPLFDARLLFSGSAAWIGQRKALIVDTQTAGMMAILVDDVFRTEQVVVKSIEENFTKVRSISGGAIMGDGEVALILDVNQLAMEVTGNAERNRRLAG